MRRAWTAQWRHGRERFFRMQVSYHILCISNAAFRIRTKLFFDSSLPGEEAREREREGERGRDGEIVVHMTGLVAISQPPQGRRSSFWAWFVFGAREFHIIESLVCIWGKGVPHH